MTDQQDGQPLAEVPMPQFLPPRTMPRHDPLPEGVTLHPASTSPAGGESTPSPEDDADSYDEPDEPQGAAASSPGSTGKRARFVSPLVTAKQVEAAQSLVGAMIQGATFLMNRRVAAGNPYDERWLITPKQRDDIAAPLARILARRSPLPTGSEGSASDLADGIEAFAAMIAYTMAQMETPAPPAPVQLHPAQHIAGVEPDAPAAPAAATVTATGPGAFFSAPVGGGLG